MGLLSFLVRAATEMGSAMGSALRHLWGEVRSWEWPSIDVWSLLDGPDNDFLERLTRG
ncbi:MAG: hypothetical protein QXP81_01540 [Nitrososphaerota archaeon]